MRKLLLLLPFVFALSLAAQTNPCQGTPQPAHCNIITVHPAAQPAGVTIVKWNLYRAATAGGYTLGNHVQSNDVSVLTFQDNTSSGQNWHYAVTAFSADGKESPFSNDLLATTPTDPPVGATITIQVF